MLLRQYVINAHIASLGFLFSRVFDRVFRVLFATNSRRNNGIISHIHHFRMFVAPAATKAVDRTLTDDEDDSFERVGE